MLGRIDFSLGFYADVWSNPGLGSEEALLDANHALRELAMQLRTERRNVWTILMKWPLHLSHKSIYEASRDLIGLSNGVFGVPQGMFVAERVDNNRKLVDNVRRLLNLPTFQP